MLHLPACRTVRNDSAAAGAISPSESFEFLTSQRPRLISGDEATYLPGTVRLPEDTVVGIKNRSFSITAKVDNPNGDAAGMLGGETGGFAFFLLHGKPTFQYNWVGLEKYTITSSESLPPGESTIRFDFADDGGGPGKGGTGTLFINGRPVAEGRIEKTVPICFSTDDAFDIGEDWGTPLSGAYEPPFRFTGTLKSVTLSAH